MESLLLAGKLGCFLVFLLQLAAAEVPKSKTICVERNDVTDVRVLCERTELIWIRKAFYGKTLDFRDAGFCALPYATPQEDCIAYQESKTEETGRLCAAFSNCNIQQSEYYDFLDECPGHAGYVYIHVDYECLPRQIHLQHETVEITHLNINVDQQRPFNHRVYMMSSSYSSWDKETPSICQIKSGPRTAISVKILDLRGRLINAATGCPFRLTFVQFQTTNNITHFDQCGMLDWDVHEMDIQAGNENMVLNVTFKREHFQGEGRTWFILEATDALGDPVLMTIACSSPRERRTTLPPTISTTTTTLASTSTTKPTTTTPAPTSPTTATPVPTLPSTTTLPSAPQQTTSQAITPQPTPAPGAATPSPAPGAATPSPAPGAATPSPAPGAATPSPAPGAATPITKNDQEPTTAAAINSGDTMNLMPIIAGACAGGILLLVILIICVICCVQKRRRNKELRERKASFEHINAWDDPTSKNFKDSLGNFGTGRNDEVMKDAQYAMMPSNQIIKEEGIYKEVSQPPSLSGRLYNNDSVGKSSTGYSTGGRTSSTGYGNNSRDYSTMPNYNLGPNHKVAPATRPKPKMNNGNEYRGSNTMAAGYHSDAPSKYNIKGNDYNNLNYNTHTNTGPSSWDYNSGASTMDYNPRTNTGPITRGYATSSSSYNNSYATEPRRQQSHTPSASSYGDRSRSNSTNMVDVDGFDAPDHSALFHAIGSPPNEPAFHNTTHNPLLNYGYDNETEPEVLY